MVFTFEDFRLDTHLRTLHRGTARVELPAKVFDLLTVLVQTPGWPMSKRALITRVWPGQAVADDVLDEHIRQLVVAIGSGQMGRPLVQPVPGVGYQFTATVQPLFEQYPPAEAEVSLMEDRPSRWGLWKWVGGIAAGLAVAAGLAFGLPRLLLKTQAAPRPILVIIPMQPVAGPSSWVGPLLDEAIAAELGSFGLFRVTLAGSPGQGQSSPIAGARYVVAGTYAELGAQIRMDVRVTDGTTGETLASEQETADESKLREAIVRVGDGLRESLKLPPPSDQDLAATPAILPGGPGGPRAWGESLLRIRAQDSAAALPFLEETIRVDPRFAPAHSALADVLLDLGMVSRARAAAQQAFDLSAGLPQEQRLANEARLEESRQKWDVAAALWTELVRMRPDTPAYALRLAHAQALSGTPAEALATLQPLRRISGAPFGAEAIAFVEALVSAAAGDGKKTAEAVAAMTSALSKRGQQAAAVRKLLQVAALAERGGDRTGAGSYYERAVSAAELAGARKLIAEAQLEHARFLGRQNDWVPAMAKAGAALANYRLALDVPDQARTLQAIAAMQREQGWLAANEPPLQEAVNLSRQVDKPFQALAWLHLGESRLLRGEFAAALASFQEGLALVSRDDVTGSRLLRGVAEVRREQGGASEALAIAQQALVPARKANDPESLVLALMTVASASLDLGDTAGARKAVMEAVEAAQGSRELAARAEIRMAHVDLAEQKFVEAEIAARRAAAAFRQRNIKHYATLAETLAYEALAWQGKGAEAAAAVLPLAAAADQSEYYEVRNGSRLSRAVTLYKAGRSWEAYTHVYATLGEAQRRGAVALDRRCRSLTQQFQTAPSPTTVARR